MMNNPYTAPAPPQGSYFGTAPGGGMVAPGAPPRMDGGIGAVDHSAIEMLRQTKPWVTFISVMMFIGSGLMVLAGLLMVVAGGLLGGRSGAPAALGLVYLPMAALYIYPAMKLWAYSSGIGRLMATQDSISLTAALAEQKAFWKFSGIMLIVLMSLYFVLFVGLVVVGAAFGSHRSF